MYKYQAFYKHPWRERRYVRRCCRGVVSGKNIWLGAMLFSHYAEGSLQQNITTLYGAQTVVIFGKNGRLTIF